jgi:hypothetical protein
MTMTHGIHHVAVNFDDRHLPLLHSGRGMPTATEMNMVNFWNATDALVLGLAVTAIATSASAKTRTLSPGLAARAQAIETGSGDGAGIAPERARALRECNALAEPVKGYTLMASHFAAYRSCMARHGEPE